MKSTIYRWHGKCTSAHFRQEEKIMVRKVADAAVLGVFSILFDFAVLLLKQRKRA